MILRSLMMACLSLAVAANVIGQGGTKATTAEVTGHVYEPAKLEPTDERISQLKLPAGFRVAKFAELSNPRMIAVADDGTIYVTQREPGTLSMLKDTNGDGIADVQVELAGVLALGVDDFASLIAAPTGGDDTIRGTSGNDVIRGLGGNDTLIGLAGADVLLGDDGNDRLVGGAGADVLNGGTGSDLFVYETAGDSPAGAGHDVIQDFRSGVDDIDLTALGDLTFIGKKGFSGTEGEFRAVSGDGFMMIEADLDGDAVADFQIELSGVTKISQTDFLIG